MMKRLSACIGIRSLQLSHFITPVHWHIVKINVHTMIRLRLQAARVNLQALYSEIFVFFLRPPQVKTGTHPSIHAMALQLKSDLGLLFEVS
jgi:hypothetical protein